MTEQPRRLTRTQAAEGVYAAGWRLLLGVLRTAVPVSSLAQAVEVAGIVTAFPGAENHLRVDLRPDRVELSWLDRDRGRLVAPDIDAVCGLSAALTARGFLPGNGSGGSRSIGALEAAIATLDMARIRPFWKAVLGYIDDPGDAEPNGLIDPVGQGPSFWFQQMDEPRTQRNRIHFDITVDEDEAAPRIAAAVAAGGAVIEASHARSFWVLADADGNEICVCTWQDRDHRDPEMT